MSTETDAVLDESLNQAISIEFAVPVQDVSASIVKGAVVTAALEVDEALNANELENILAELLQCVVEVTKVESSSTFSNRILIARENYQIK